MNFNEQNFLCHYGILGMKWGIRRYQNPDGSLTAEGKKHYGGSEKDRDIMLKKDTELQTLSADPNRVKDAEYFYASVTENDKQYYTAFFGLNKHKKVANLVPTCKINISSKLAKDVNVASEKTGTKIMQDLYNTDDDFRDFITNPERLNKIMRKGMNWEAYKKANKVLEKVSTEGEASPEEIAEIYKCFNYILPNDGKGNEAIATDVANQRKKFFDELKSKGYGAVLDTNDAYYGGYGNNVDTDHNV